MFVRTSRFSYFYLDLYRKLYAFRRGFDLKNILLWPLNQNFDTPNFAKNVILVLNHPKTQAHYFSNLQTWLLLSNSPSQTRNLYRSIPLKNAYFCSVGRNIDSLEIPKEAKKNSLPRSSSSHFSKVTCLILFSQGLVRNFSSVEENMLQKQFTLRLGSEF